MDSISNKEITEEQKNKFVLSDKLPFHILSELSWKDILKPKLVELSGVKILYVEDSEGYPFSVYSTFASIPDCESRKSSNQKHVEIERGDQMSRFLKMFDMRNLSLLDVYVYGCFILHVCCHSTESKDVNPVSILQSFNITRSLLIYECNETRILTSDIVDNFLRRNLSVQRLTIGSGNSEFIRNLFKEDFAMDQPHKMENKLWCSKISLQFFGNEYKQLSRILMNDLYERENVQEVISIQNFPENSEIESVINCRHCPKDKHKIEINVSLMGVFLNTCDR
uniref:FTH domain-containing protein n=1 Tax=Strongyloides venezuelensis TaxID=75913 RepID=A0A0K0FZN6_STRVS